MNIDWSVNIGRDHVLCEDYVTNNENTLVLCDGCSGSSNTDVGARLIAHFALLAPDRPDDIIRASAMLAEQLKLPSCIDATCIIAREEGCTIKVTAYGDGNIIGVQNSGDIEWHSINYVSGAPYYLSYRINPARKSSYEYFGGHSPKYEYMVDSSGTPGAYECRYDHVTELSFPKQDYKYVIITSDGLETFKNHSTGQVLHPWDDELIHKIIDFKNTNGPFVKRRIKRLLEELAKEKIYHWDDFSIGVIKI